MMRVMCAVCKRPVDRQEVTKNHCSLRQNVRVWCHGATDECTVDDDFLWDAKHARVEAVAFRRTLIPQPPPSEPAR